MYFPKLYPDELLYSAIARCRVHLGVGSHKVLVRMLFGDSKVAAITDLPGHLTALASNTGVSAAGLVTHHTLFPLYAPFIPQERRHDLYQAMLSSNRPTIGLAGASMALVKWPEWLRFCPACFEEMASRFGEPYWRRCWQIQGVEVCPEHGCQLLDSPVPFRRAQRHEFHAASPLFIPSGDSEAPPSQDAVRLAMAVEQLLAYEDERSPGYGRWTNFYRDLANECGARRGRQVRAGVIWERLLASYRRDWLEANGLWGSSGPPPWLLAIFRRHRKAFSALQHLIIWTSLRPGEHVGEMIRVANAHQSDISAGHSRQQLPAEFRQKLRYRAQWRVALKEHGGAKVARESGGQACYAWLYRHDRAWFAAANKVRHKQQGNNSRIDWQERDKVLVRLLIQSR
ncbi:MAG: TnsD family Tn7-like transposition protein [Candidatus Thiodiazotropha endolucinida]|nr:TnsD family transposase [Candidatus Thiodiazotropha taylori]MCW4250158.1 TnsD family transposase [Candidatus Thiodiazotropha endolucinida]MCG7883543.1 TnsD family transposase [Candidatus Thiodiazotropha taylori]MCG8058722.1 TnsD family transposase [Candidatus Thiodiazotropha taylori]MCG8104613.1 TnsD family transposase [Candidatus Thiodiazotropha taylori]